MMKKIYPRTGDTQTVYLNTVIKDPSIEVGDYTIYNDFVSNPLLFEHNNVLYHYPINHERLIIGKFCSIACVHIPADTRSAFPVISVQSPVSIQCCWQS